VNRHGDELTAGKNMDADSRIAGFYPGGAVLRFPAVEQTLLFFLFFARRG